MRSKLGLFLSALLFSALIAGCARVPLRMQAPQVPASSQIVVRIAWDNPVHPYGSYLSGYEGDLTQDFNRLLNHRLHLAAGEKLVLKVRKLGSTRGGLSIPILTIMDVTLYSGGEVHTKTFRDESVVNSTNASDVMRGAQKSIRRVLNQIVDFVQERGHA